MSNDNSLNANGKQLSSRLSDISAKEQAAKIKSERTINVAGVGRMVSVAYEQLRNAAENMQEHLLIQGAIRRFYVRNLFLPVGRDNSKSIAEELVIELTQAGYIKNDTQPVNVIKKISDIIDEHYDNYTKMKAAGVDERRAQSWTLDILSISSERIVQDNNVQIAYVEFAYHHYLATLKKTMFTSSKSNDGYEASLYVAVQKSLTKFDIAAVRYEMQQLYKVSSEKINDYIKFHENIDEVFSSDMTNNIVRYINKYGAPLRIFFSMIQENDKTAELLKDKNKFIKAYEEQINLEYSKAGSKLNRGLFRSIAFLIVTKTLIGVGIEVPYDLVTIGEVLLVPLLVNLFTPVVYMALLRFSVSLPGKNNTETMISFIEDMLYGDKESASLYPAEKKKSYPIGFTIAYALMFFVVFGFVINLLVNLRFNLLQGVIFFIFLATASFLGFRLSRIVKELEVVISRQNFWMAVKDFIFMPFTALGKWISDKYQKVNIIAMILDIFIEFPLKTVLRLIRQWTKFIDEKKEEI